MTFGSALRDLADRVRYSANRAAQAIREAPYGSRRRVDIRAVEAGKEYHAESILASLGNWLKSPFYNKPRVTSRTMRDEIYVKPSALVNYVSDIEKKVLVRVDLQHKDTGLDRSIHVKMTQRQYETFINDPDKYMQGRIPDEEEYDIEAFRVVGWA